MEGKMKRRRQRGVHNEKEYDGWQHGLNEKKGVCTLRTNRLWKNDKKEGGGTIGAVRLNLVPPPQPNQQASRDIFHHPKVKGLAFVNNTRSASKHTSVRMMTTKYRTKFFDASKLASRYSSTPSVLKAMWPTSAVGWADC